MTPKHPKYNDLAERALTMTTAELARHYGVTHSSMTDKLRSEGIKPITGKSERDYADLSELCLTMHCAALARHYGVTESTMHKTLKKRGLKAAKAPAYIPRKNASTARWYGKPRATKAPPSARTEIDLAAEYLRRECAVYRCDQNGAANPRGKFWMRGRAIKTDAEIVALAGRKGWNPREWMGVAA